MIAVGSSEGRLPDDTEARMAAFTELCAIAVANAQSRAELVGSRARLVAAADEARRLRSVTDTAEAPPSPAACRSDLPADGRLPPRLP
ncbi:hypothetical protein [Actinoplanes sp. NPDC048796]|uniref:hypothetical protein n=1 Tax=Actinoplanes sp. NPDC048796 TaxID=3155640 RepID=UPI00340F233A